MQNAGSQIQKCFIYLEIGGNHVISNLIAKDISSEENSIKIDFNQAGSIIICNSQFENITKIGNIVAGGAINAILQSSNTLNIKDCIFTTCKAQDTFGGAIYAEIKNSNAQIELTRTQFLQCTAQSGGGLSAISNQGGSFIIENSCIFKDCNAIAGNGGGIYLNFDYEYNVQTSFVIREALIQNCQAVASASDLKSTGFGGGIFIGVNGTRSPPSMSLDLKGMKIYNNSASQGGQSLYVVITKLKDWCEYGLLGEYVKGNYSEIDSNENDLQGIPIDFYQFASQSQQYIINNQKLLEDYWRMSIPSFSIWHVYQQFGQYNGSDTQSCGEVTFLCKTIEYAIQLISLNKGGLETIFVEEKNIGISQYGYDLTSPIQLGKSFSYTNIINIMKQMYGTPSQIQRNAEMKIMKNNDNNKENGKVGWISAFEGLQLHLYCLNIIMDNSQLLIPIIYIQDSDSTLELHTITFSGIKLSPSTESKGTIQINVDNSQFIAQYCIFQNINISSQGGNTIRILNSGTYPITSTIKACQFNNISSIGDSNGLGGSAIYMESKHGSKLIIEESCQFYQCIIDKGNGGAIYIDIDFTSQFLFNINDTLIQECNAKESSSSSSPTGYGGGIFLTGNGDYDPSTNRLDLRGMRIFGNIAEIAGQSLYVAMTKVAEWCQRGSTGEYAKGNYTDGMSNVNELEGINVDSTNFNSYSSTQIKQKQNYLESYWNIIMVDYYVNSTGNDDWRCNLSKPCKTLDASVINSNINNINAYFVYIYDSTSITNTAVISQTVTPRTFRNYPLDTTQLSSILIRSAGRFNITGKVRFQLINFTMESSQLQKNLPGIYVLSQLAEIDMQDCDFHMQNAGTQIGKCFIYLLGGSHAISNLISKDISSEENSIKIDFNQAGSIIICNSQFENITKIGSTVVGGAISAILESSNKLDIKDCIFTTCKAQDTFGGAIYAEIKNSNAQITLTRTQFLQCTAQSGGGLSVIIDQGGSFIIENSCIFKDCNAIAGNGGGIYLNLDYGLNDQTSFVIRDALIQDCQAVISASDLKSTGFGGGIFIGVNGTRSPPSMSLDLKGMKIQSNSASQGGQSLYAVMDKLKDWCEYGLLGEYVKGNYSDTDSNENDLQGIPIDFKEFQTLTSEYIEQNQKKLEHYWRMPIPLYSIWHVLDRNQGQQGIDTFDCGEIISPCKTIEYAIQQISVNKGGLETIFIEEKNIGINQYGYDLTSPIQLSKSGSHTDLIKIMKQMYDTPSQMQGQAEMKIMKNNDNNKENGKVGWISAFEGLQLHLYCLNITMDNSQLLIPIIYIQDSDSILELNLITFSEIQLFPTTEAKGIIHIVVDNSQFIAQSCIFQNINISSQGGNTIRILNNGSYPITSTIKVVIIVVEQILMKDY
ncbi:MAG: hypothetical protein EZS28_020537 [Streblomastix strix]|uniref:Uncharacterized protein n=1 Tax=Streblomastix strix TaxID=222440 RepID=A0A5J4VNH6_9EUKA|nr:MAG: hypothetical protein EZS28_020537 [Streblomastix strix]